MLKTIYVSIYPIYIIIFIHKFNDLSLRHDCYPSPQSTCPPLNSPFLIEFIRSKNIFELSGKKRLFAEGSFHIPLLYPKRTLVRQGNQYKDHNMSYTHLLIILTCQDLISALLFHHFAVHAERLVHVLLMFPFMSTVHVDIVCFVFGLKLVAL